MISHPSPFAAKPDSRVPGIAGIDALRDRFLQVRQVTERLAAPLSVEDCALQSMPDARWQFSGLRLARDAT